MQLAKIIRAMVAYVSKQYKINTNKHLLEINWMQFCCEWYKNKYEKVAYLNRGLT